MKPSAVSAVVERENPTLTFGDLVAAVSEVAEADAPELITALFEARRARFVDPGALDRLARLTHPLPSVRRAPRARPHGVPRRRASGAN